VASAAPAAATAPAQQSAPQSEGFFSSLARKVGLGGGATADTTAATPPAAPAKPKVADKREAAKPKPAETRQAATRPPFKPSITDGASEQQQAAPAAQAPAAQPNNMVAGAQPIVQPNSFDSRFSAVK
jgi:hypothetical protein